MQIFRSFILCAVSMSLLACGDKESEMQEEMGNMDESSMDESMPEPTGEYVADYGDTPEIEPPEYGPNDIVISVSDLDQQVRLVLTPSNLTMKLSADAIGRLRSQVNSRDLKDDLKSAILASITEVAISELEEAADRQREKRSRHEIRYPISAVNSIHFQNGRLWIDLEREKSLSFDDIKTADGRPVLTNFDEWDAETFAVAFQSM
ncbi:MAG: hypothetical protein K0U72_01540 [Gammaproteobacteria bacterium]|nr:hypothetical protein [Gammaproteobacteria bacterium]